MRTPPHNLECERAVLGAAMLDPKRVLDIRLVLTADDFWREAHAEVWRTIEALDNEGRECDAIAVATELDRLGRYKELGGHDLMAELAHAAPHSANAEYHAGIVHELAVMRRLIRQAEQTIEECYQPLRDKTAAVLASEAEARLYGIADVEARGRVLAVPDLSSNVLDRIHNRREGRVTGVETGWFDADELIDGLPDGGLSILAGRPSMGKTAMALNIVEHAVSRGLSVHIASLEMGALELAERLMVQHARVDGHRVRTGEATDQDLIGLNLAHDWYRKNSRVHIDASPISTVADIASRARRTATRHGLDLVVVDYLQLIEPSNGKDSSRQEQVSDISRRLKILAGQLKVPVLALSQLNRQCEQREDKRPRASDLRESGSLEQDADLVLMLHRPDHYNATDQPGIAELIVAKNRNGPTGVVRLVFLKHCMRFEDLAAQIDPATF